MDSFVVDFKCHDLKQITKAVGGKCFSLRTLEAGVRLFELETILSAKRRKVTNPFKLEQMKNALLIAPRNHRFDDEPYEIAFPK